MHGSELGKITSVTFGCQDSRLGISFVLSGKNWGVGDFWGTTSIAYNEHCQWTEEDRLLELGVVALRIRDVLNEANKTSIDQLIGMPVEVTFDNSILVSWRILTEVI